MISQKLTHLAGWLRERAAQGKPLDVEALTHLANRMDDLTVQVEQIEACWIAPRARREAATPMARHPYGIALTAQRHRRRFLWIKGDRS